MSDSVPSLPAELHMEEEEEAEVIPAEPVKEKEVKTSTHIVV